MDSTHFKTIFYKRYFILSKQSQKYTKFVNLTQENMMLAKYKENFNELQRLAPSLVDTEEKKIDKFLVRLRPERVRVVARQRHRTYSEVLQCAQSVTQYDENMVALQLASYYRGQFS